jgi:hypothetical protein
MNRETIWTKANAAAEAWRARYGSDPAQHVHALTLVMSVALHETSMGEAWSNSGNWGAVQRRAMTVAEKAQAKAGIVPPPADAFELLMGDSSPETGKYQVWFWRFPAAALTAKGQSGDVAGADKLLEVLLDERHSIGAAIDTVSPEGLAAMMYASQYFEGFFDPRANYQLVGGKWVKLADGETPQPGATVSSGKALDIGTYATALEGASAQIRAALVGWTPGAPPPQPEVGSVLWAQRALNRLGAAPQLAEDGIQGPATTRAVKTYQSEAGPPLVASGDLDVGTVASIVDDLARLDGTRS